jgi:flagellin
MGLGVLNNLASLQAQNQLQSTSQSLQSTLYQLSSGQRINSGADDPAGLAIANQLSANTAALSQSVNNANNGIGLAQVEDGGLSQVTNMLNRAVTLATEASSGGLSTQQSTALDNEYQSIITEIGQINTNTTFNGMAVFSSTNSFNVMLTDAVTTGTISVSSIDLATTSAGLSLSGTSLGSTTSALAALSSVNSAIQTVASDRGTLGAQINRLNDAINVMNVQVQNVTSAENTIMAANIPQTVANLAKYTILNQTGIYSLSQADQSSQALLSLLH